MRQYCCHGGVEWWCTRGFLYEVCTQHTYERISILRTKRIKKLIFIYGTRIWTKQIWNNFSASPDLELSLAKKRITAGTQCKWNAVARNRKLWLWIFMYSIVCIILYKYWPVLTPVRYGLPRNTDQYWPKNTGTGCNSRFIIPRMAPQIVQKPPQKWGMISEAEVCDMIFVVQFHVQYM